ncbi:MAG: phosphohydrolase [Deltaproteobacteria bacterium HGW-Deltaproteobacteria-22]|jgi:hypothetical protein|nr:MAG: phosphohydrolase [Deltaproteobacteria bacterium HGW-Deltaproteobacteria-22]
MNKSPKESGLDRFILKKLPAGPLRALAGMVLADEEVHALQEYANNVSIKRLGFNDHGPVHMRKVLLNALTLAELLHTAGIPLSLEAEEIGAHEDSLTAIFLAGMLHDVGMSVTRSNHEEFSMLLAHPLLERFLLFRYPDDLRLRVIVRSLITECVTGHMGTIDIHSLEAGIILIADGCDMEKGRARIPMMISTNAKVGDIHKYSSSAIERIDLTPGEHKPIRITIHMSSSVGFFQVEEVLFPKLAHSPIKPYVELHAGVIGEGMKIYL